MHQHLVQCHIYRSSNPKGQLPKPTDPSVVRLVRIAKPFVDTPETILKCLGESVPPSNSSNVPNSSSSSSSNFLQPIVEYLDQANLQYITFMSSSGPNHHNSAFHKTNEAEANEKRSADALKSKLRGVNDVLKKYDRKSGENALDSVSAPSSSSQQAPKSVDEQIRQVLASHGKKNMVHVALYPAFSDGTCDLSSVSDEEYEGPLKLKEPLLEQLESRSGIPLLPNSSFLNNTATTTNANGSAVSPVIAAKRRAMALNAASSVITLAVVLVVESTTMAAKRKNSSDNNHSNNNTSPLRLKSPTRNERRRSSASGIGDDGEQLSSLSLNNKKPSQRNKIINTDHLIDGVDPLQFASNDEDDDDVSATDPSRKLDLNNNNAQKSSPPPSQRLDATSKPFRSFSVSFRQNIEQHEGESSSSLHHHNEDEETRRKRTEFTSLGSFSKFPVVSEDGGENDNQSNFVLSPTNTNTAVMMSPTMLAARKRRLEQLREENIAKLERKRAEEERRRREKAARYEKERQERLRLEKDIRHQAELAQTRQQIREIELERKRKLYETRENDLDDERREFSRRLEEYSTIAQIESLKAEQEAEKEAERRRRSSAEHNHFLEFTQQHQNATTTNSNSKQLNNLGNNPRTNSAKTTTTSQNNNNNMLSKSTSGGHHSSSTFTSSSPTARAFSSKQIGEEKNDNGEKKKMSQFVEKDLDGLVQRAVIRSNDGDQNMAELEVERAKQRRQVHEQQGLNVLLKDLGKKKIQTSKQTRKQLFDYKEALAILKR